MCFCHFLRPVGHNFDEERERGEKKDRQRERERREESEQERQEYYNVADLPLKNKKELVGNISNISGCI